MIDFDKETWDKFVSNFTDRLCNGYKVEIALKYFIEDYWATLDNLASEACEKEEVKESPEEYATKTYLREKNQIIWDYVYNLNREIGNLRKEIDLTKKANAQDNQPLKGLMPEGFATSGYMQVTDKKYTPEQIAEWNSIRWTPKDKTDD